MKLPRVALLIAVAAPLASVAAASKDVSRDEEGRRRGHQRRRAPTRARSASRRARVPGCRSTCRPTARRSSSTCWATSTRCRSRAAPRARSPAGPAGTRSRAISPDGKTIAFTSDRGGIENIWLMDADGKNPRALTAEKDAYVRTAAWTPDGDYLVARKEDGKRAGIPPVELWLYHREGGSGVKLTSSDDINNASRPRALARRPLDLFRRAQAAASTTSRTSPTASGRSAATTAGPPRRFQVTEGFGGGVRPAPSPDGKTLAYVSRRDNDTVLVLRDLAGGGERSSRATSRATSRKASRRWTSGPAMPSRPTGRPLVFSNHGRLVRLDARPAAQSQRDPVHGQGRAVRSRRA